MKTSITTKILWGVYISLLAVLLPHTAWAFNKFEPVSTLTFFGISTSVITSWLAALTFEAAIGTLTHKLSERINATPKGKRGWARFVWQYVNGFSFMLISATLISMAANLAHAVEFGSSLVIFTAWGIDPVVYSVAFGGALPLVSLGFANVLSNVTDTEDLPNPEFTALMEREKTVRSQLRESEQHRRAAEDRANIAEQRFDAMGDMVRRIFGEDKRERILAARRQWVGLPNSAIAVIAESSPAYVSEVLSKSEA